MTLKSACGGHNEADGHSRSRVLFPILVALMLLHICRAGSTAVSAKHVLENASKHYDVIKDYVVDAVLTVDSPSMHIPETSVRIYYKKPDKVHVESKGGFAILPKNGLVMGNPVRDLMSADYLPIVGSARIGNRDCYIIRADFASDDRPMESKVWIDKKDWLVMRISANPGYGPSVDVELKYLQVQGKYWLPAYTKAQLSIPPITRRRGGFKPGIPQPTTAVIRFANYIVNKGIDDSIFAEKAKGGR